MKKFLAMALAAVMVLALAACGSKNDTADDTGDAQDAQGGETQKLIVGFDAEFPPFGFIAADGTYDGFDLAMAKELCARLGWEYEAGHRLEQQGRRALQRHDQLHLERLYLHRPRK